MSTEKTSPKPKAFISYSWTTPGHQALVKSWADRLIADGIDVILDIYDLKEGHDKYHFMERAVNDATVTHVLMICDKSTRKKPTRARRESELSRRSSPKRFTTRSNNLNFCQLRASSMTRENHICLHF
jgi:hypothetical protein